MAVAPFAVEEDSANLVLAEDDEQKGIHLANILKGEEDARDQVDLHHLDDLFLLPVGGLKECDIKAVLGNSGEILRSLMVPAELRYWCVGRPAHKASHTSEVGTSCWIRNLPGGTPEEDLRQYIKDKADLEPTEVEFYQDSARLSFETADQVTMAFNKLNETNFGRGKVTVEFNCGRKHARKPLRCCNESMIPCQGPDGNFADWVCVNEKSGRICGKKFFDYPTTKPEKCTKCGAGKEDNCFKYCGRLPFVCKKCGYRMEQAEYSGKGHCCKGHMVHDLLHNQAPYECRKCGVKYNRPGLNCCLFPVQPTARYVCLSCRREYLEGDGVCGNCKTQPVALSICGSCVQPDPGNPAGKRRPTLLPINTSGRTDASELEVRQEDIDHLNEQSLVDTDYTVSVEARSLPPSFKASQACDLMILSFLAQRGNDVLLRTKIAQAVITTAWIQFRLHTALDIVLQASVVLALAICSFEVRYERTPLGWLIFLVVLHAKRSLEEVSQWMTSCAEAERRKRMKKALAELFALDNFVDVLFIIVGWFALIRRLVLPPGIDAWMAAFCAWNWLRLLYSLRGELWIGPRLLPIFFALRESLGFFFVVFMAVAASSHAYYDLQLRMEAAEVVAGKWYRPLFEAYTAVLQIGRLGIWGDFDLYEFEGLDPSLERDQWDNVTGILNPVDPPPSPDGVYIFAHLLFFVTGVGVTVLLMNLLIGILSTDFGLYEQKSSELFNRARAKMMKEIGSRPSTIALQFVWARWLKLASMAKQDHIIGASACVPMLLKCAALPLQLVLGQESFKMLVDTPLVPFVRYSGPGLVTLLLVLFSPAIFALSLAILIMSLIPAMVLRVSALRHLLNGGLGVRADDANKSAWFASQCGIVVFYGGDSDGFNGSRKAFEATRGELQATRGELWETRTSLVESLTCIKAHVGVPLTKEEEEILRPKRALLSGRDNSAPPATPDPSVAEDENKRSLQSSVFQDYAKSQQEKMTNMERRLNDLHAGLDVATDRLTWACQVLYKTSTQLEELQRSQEHLVGYIEQRLVGYLGEHGSLRGSARPGAGPRGFPTAQRQPSPMYQPDYGFQGSPVYSVEDGLERPTSPSHGATRGPQTTQGVIENVQMQRPARPREVVRLDVNLPSSPDLH